MGGVVRVDLPGEAVAVEDRVGDQARRHAITDLVDRLDAGLRQSIRRGHQLVVERVVRYSLGQQHDTVDGEL